MFAWWSQGPNPGNFGDILTPYIFEKLTGRKLNYKHYKQLKKGDLISVGSIVNFAVDNINVWGSGVMSRGNPVNTRAVYHAVRGPISRDEIIKAGGKCPAIYGDPALLLPLFYSPVIAKKYRFGIIPHYVDYQSVLAQMKGSDVKVIDILGPDIEGFIDQLLECESIVSSSLHGIITAHAYGIPSAWAKFSDKLVGDGSKFNDYFQSVGIDMPCHDFKQGITQHDVESLQYVAAGKLDELKLLRSFPYPMKPDWLDLCQQTFAS